MAETKKAPDYSQSAENLCNPPEVLDLLVKLHLRQLGKEILEAKLKETCPEIIEEIDTETKLIDETQKEIREAIEKYGSYQDVEGNYAVKYRRMVKSYHVEPFKIAFPQHATSVIEEAINVKVLDGFIKGNIITEQDLKDKQVITETPQYAFYVR